jgi:hypothetical protein
MAEECYRVPENRVTKEGPNAAQRQHTNRPARLPSSSARKSKRPPGDGPPSQPTCPLSNLVRRGCRPTCLLSTPTRRGYRLTCLPSNLARWGCRPTCPLSNLARQQPTIRRTPLLKGRADLVLLSHVGTMGHHLAMPRPWKRYRRVSIKHDARYVSPLTSGIGQPWPPGPQHQGHYSDPYARRDSEIRRTRYTPMYDER